MRTLVILLLVMPAGLSAQPARQDSLWRTFQQFSGKWKGVSEGQPGNGTYNRTYQFVLDKKFMEVRNKSTYAPTPKSPKGVVHEDVGYISYDQARKTFVLRQFHIEGFVNQYKLESISADGKTIVFITESIENIPAGWRARETYNFVSENEFTELFELAPPVKEFELYSRATLTRVP